eukprot:gene4290-4859_t
MQMEMLISGVVDKGTINRRTSQASYVIFMDGGKHCAYPLGAPLVSSKTNESDDDSLESESQSSSNEDTNCLQDITGVAANLLNLLE